MLERSYPEIPSNILQRMGRIGRPLDQRAIPGYVVFSRDFGRRITREEPRGTRIDETCESASWKDVDSHVRNDVSQAAVHAWQRRSSPSSRSQCNRIPSFKRLAVESDRRYLKPLNPNWPDNFITIQADA